MYEFTKCAESTLEFAKEFAIENKCGYVGTEHILYGLAKVQKGIASKILQSQNVGYELIGEKIKQFNSNINKKRDIKLTPRAQKIIENSVCECKKMNNNYVGTEHILLSIIKETDSVAVKILIDLNVDPTKMMLELVKLVSDGMEIMADSEHSIIDAKLPPNLSNYAKNLTYLAEVGKLEPLFERKEELEQIAQILQRKTKNNVLIIGEAGVGKTALVEGLAYEIACGKACESLKEKQIILLDIASMVAGAKYRGDFEERLKNTIKEVKENPKYILFIDEIHTIIGAGSAEGAIDAASILKPMLARNEIKVIGATTFDEYKKRIERDSALARRFQNVVLEEPTYDKCIKILKGLRTRYEKYHSVVITDGAIDMSVKLSMRYITLKSLPDKALDLLDEACICAKKRGSVKGADVCKVLSKLLKVPVSKLTQNEANKYKNLEQRIKQKIIGQDEAVSVISKAVIRGRVGLKDPKRPVGCFMFLGPTGVGKTELVKVLVNELFDSDKNLIRFDMSEYSEQHSIAKLIGAPPGYVGYEEGGKLTEEVKKKPYSVVLFDEIEKAHPDIYNILLQMMDEGRLTDAMSRTIDFKNTICILTSNVGAKNIVQDNRVGFGTKEDAQDENKKMKQAIKKELKNTFNPEFLNRLDEVIIFKKLDYNSIKKITKLLLDEEMKRVSNYGMKLTYSENVIEKIAKSCMEEMYGARPIKREIQTLITDKLAEYLITQKSRKNREILLDVVDGDIAIQSVVNN